MISWIDSSSAFAEFCRSLPTGQPVAIDTEFDWQKSCYPVFALLQIGIDRENAALIDPFAVTDWEPLRQLLNDASRRKIFFSGGNDLPILVRACGGAGQCLPVNVFDVQTAYLFLGKTTNVALKTIIQEEMGIELDKSETRSDWTIRPLTDKQREYAAGDVVLLPELAQSVEARLRDAGNLEFFLEEMTVHSRPESYDEPPCEHAYLKISSYRNVPRSDVRARLRALAAWRERTARSGNVARSRIFKDEQLLWIAQSVPSSVAALHGMPEFRRSAASKYGEAAIASMKEHVPELPQVGTPVTPQMKSAMKELAERIIRLVQKRAGERGIAPTLVAARREVENLALRLLRKKPVDGINMLTGWRRQILDPAISGIIAE